MKLASNAKRWMTLALAVTISLAMMVVAVPAKAVAAQDTLTIMLWGATWNVGVKDVAAKFEKTYGVKVKAVMQSGSAEGLAKLQAMQGDRGVDVWFCDSAMPGTAPPDLIADIDAAKITNRADLIDGALTRKYVAQLYYPQGIVYRPDISPLKIETWEDLWRPEFKNQLAVPPPSFDQGTFLVVAARISGGGEGNIEPGFERMRQLQSNIVAYYDNDATSRKLLAQGEVSVVVGNVGSLSYLTDNGVAAEVIYPKPTPISFDVMTVIKGGNEDLAHKFIDMMMTPWAQEISVLPHQCAPVNAKVDASAVFTGGFPKPEDTLVVDHGAIKQNLDRWIEQWDKEFTR